MRTAEPQHAEDITRVINAAFRLAESFLMDRNRIDLESVQSLMQTGKFLIALGDDSDDNGVLAGSVYVEPRGERAYVGLLSVDPGHQKTGLGSALMSAAERYCRETGCRFIDLQLINLREELPAFYRRRGYVETGSAPLTPGLQPKLPCHFIKMSKALI